MTTGPTSPSVHPASPLAGSRRVAGQVLIHLGLGWLIAAGMMFVYSAVAGSTWPSSWRAPWSGECDFVVLPDGRVAVYISSFDRLELYSPEGDFEGAWRRVKGYVGGEARLSVTSDGRLFVRASHGRLRSYAEDGTLLEARSAEGARGWRLGPDGEPVPLDRPPGPEPTRAVDAGEVLVAGYPAHRRSEFEGGDGLRATAVGSRLVLDRPDGGEVVLGTPWYLMPLKMPVPGCAPFLLLLLFATVDDLRRRRRASRRRR